MIHKKCNIISNQEIAAGSSGTARKSGSAGKSGAAGKSAANSVFEMLVDTRDFPKSLPGQFIMVHLDKGEMLLPRPISICRQAENLMLLVYKVLGKGTEYLSTFKPGDEIRLMGPLGNGFSFRDDLKKIALIGGGIGIPPMVSIYDAIKDRDIEIHVYLGYKDGHFLTNLFPGAKLHIITENLDTFKDPPYPSGEVFPEKGNTITLLEHFNEDYDEMYACGPKPMLSALTKFAADKNIPLQISLEERMACGVGVCMGCVVPPDYMKICCAGPVFYSDKVVLDCE